MLWHKHKNSPEWEETDTIIDNWLQERQELLIVYQQISQSKGYSSESFDKELLSIFCEILVDYVSAGHFEVFEKLAKASEICEKSGLDPKLLVEILKSTMTALEFSEKYSLPNFKFKNLKLDLSKVGEKLSHRLDLEDQLIGAYLNATHLLKKTQQN